MKIIIADDHRLLRETLVETFESLEHDVEVIQASTLPEAEDAIAKAGSVELIVLDLMMPGMDGADGIQKICSRHPDCPVVILSGKIDRKTIVESLKNGAKGFIPKTIGRDAMLNAIRLVLSGDTYVPTLALDDMQSFDDSDDADDQKNQKQMAPALQELTQREWDVLKFLIKGHPNKLIARELGLEEVTIKSHLSNVYRKLEVTNRAQAVAKALELEWED